MVYTKHYTPVNLYHSLQTSLFKLSAKKNQNQLILMPFPLHSFWNISMHYWSVFPPPAIKASMIHCTKLHTPPPPYKENSKHSSRRMGNAKVSPLAVHSLTSIFYFVYLQRLEWMWYSCTQRGKWKNIMQNQKWLINSRFFNQSTAKGINPISV